MLRVEKIDVFFLMIPMSRDSVHATPVHFGENYDGALFVGIDEMISCALNKRNRETPHSTTRVRY